MTISTFLGLETTLRGILAQQRALDVTGHNIANANTAGYTRQQAELQQTDAFGQPGIVGQIGTGVDVVSYRRIRDDFLDTQLHAQTMRQGYYEATSDGLGQVELALAEPSDNGISHLLSGYWSSWQDVANAPEDGATRQALVQDAAALADGFNQLHDQLATLASQADENVNLTLADVNADGVEIARLTGQITQMLSVGEQPNDLLDKRDALLDHLAKLTNVTVADDGGGSITVKIGTQTLVSGQTATTLATTDFAPGDLTAGKLAALVELRDVTLPGYTAQIDAVADAVIAQTNALHETGYDLDGNQHPAATEPFLLRDATSGDVVVNPVYVADPRKIAASKTGGPGEGGIALDIAGLRSSSTIEADYRSFVTQVGSDARDAQRTADNAKALADSLTNRRSSISGVSLDEEMTNLLRFQRGFQASARALTAMDSMLELLIQRTGRAGL